MKTILLLLIISLLSLLVSCKPQEKKMTTVAVVEDTTVFLKMQRTPCYGKCPSYVVEIFNNGKVSYLGKMFVDYIGQHESIISKADLDLIKTKINEINFFELKDKYDSPATDLPSTIFEVTLNKQSKKITNRHHGPPELKDLEKLVEEIVYKSLPNPSEGGAFEDDRKEKGNQ